MFKWATYFEITSLPSSLYTLVIRCGLKQLCVIKFIHVWYYVLTITIIGL